MTTTQQAGGSTAATYDPLRLCVFTTVALLTWLIGPAVVVAFAALGFTGYVKARRAGLTPPDDPRTLDQKRFDAMLDICRTPGTERDLIDLVGIHGPGAADDAESHDGQGGLGRDDNHSLDDVAVVVRLAGGLDRVALVRTADTVRRIDDANLDDRLGLPENFGYGAHDALLGLVG